MSSQREPLKYRYLVKFFRRYGVVFALTLAIALLAAVIGQTNLLHSLETLAFDIGIGYHDWYARQSLDRAWVLLPLSFLGGLVVSISPCVLGLLPVNLSYIGTRDITSGWEAFKKATGFVLGVVTMLSLFGLFSAFGAAVLIQYAGFVRVGVGAIVILMALSLMGVVRLPLPQTSAKLPISGSFGVGLTFALVSSPCSSPVMFAVLAAGAETGSPVLGALAMASFALGFSAIVFFASLFAGLAKQTRALLPYSGAIVKFASVVLLVLGAFYSIDGLWWIAAWVSTN
ncbi:cytochrome c biogenesis protein CcdA [Baaleninema sp.]|uniref:cytochrome c biogenesis protein CcdA n=1 Tax=Baaleninema sp. TaxID=3101197 RepID=UPI003D03632D